MALHIKKRPPASSNRTAKDRLKEVRKSPVTEVAEKELRQFAIHSSEMYETLTQQNSALLDQLEARIKASNELVDEGFEQVESAVPVSTVEESRSGLLHLGGSVDYERSRKR